MSDDVSALNLSELRTFAAVAEERHFGRAALRLHLSQPAVSRHVSRLEAVCGTRLLNRTKRRVSLTVAGEAVLSHVYLVQAAAARMLQHVREVSSGAIGRVRIGTTPSAVFGGAGVLIQHFEREHPRFDVEWRVGHRAALAEAVSKNELDMAVVSGRQLPAWVRAELIGRGRLCLAWAPSTNLAASPARWPASVRWVVRDPATSASEYWEAWTARQPRAPRAGITVQSAHDMRAALIAGLGPGLIEESLVDDDVRAGCLRRHRPSPPLWHELYLIDHPDKHHGAACRTMVAMLRDARWFR